MNSTLFSLITICLCRFFVLVILAGPLDCSANVCGAEKWIIQSAAYKKYFVNANCSGGIELQKVCDKCSVECLCPSATLLDPCTCAASSVYSGTVDISCAGKTIGDDRMTSIISNTTATLPIGKLDLSRTNLTQVPAGLANLTTIAELLLSGNDITAVHNGALALNSSTFRKLDLSSNAKLATIGDSSLPRKCCMISNTFFYSYIIIFIESISRS